MIEDTLRKYGTYYSDKYFKDITTIKMGGHIKHFVEIDNADNLRELISILKSNKISFKVVGNGSNLICGESEYDGVVISLKKLNSYEISNDEIYVEAGVMVPMLANILANQGLSCLEFASGIPGTIGGLVCMNAGAYKNEISDVLNEVLVLKDNELVWMNNNECNFSYRYSVFQEHPRWIIIAAKLKLVKKPSDELLELMQDRFNRRKQTQPLDIPSAGSCFRNPKDHYAWKLIDNIGYRGYTKSGICVSDKHSNFLVNNGGGTATDYLDIVYSIQDKVQTKFGIKLIMEVEKFNC